MNILGLEIGWLHLGRRRRRKVTGKLDRIASAALLDAAVKDPHVMATVINKYGKIRVHHDDEMEIELKNIRTKIHSEAVQTVLNSQRQELDTRVNETIDRVIGHNSVHGVRQYEEGAFEGVATNGQNCMTNTIRQRRGMQQSLKRGSNPSMFLKILKMLAVRGKITTRQIKRQDWGGMEE